MHIYICICLYICTCLRMNRNIHIHVNVLGNSYSHSFLPLNISRVVDTLVVTFVVTVECSYRQIQQKQRFMPNQYSCMPRKSYIIPNGMYLSESSRVCFCVCAASCDFHKQYASNPTTAEPDASCLCPALCPCSLPLWSSLGQLACPASSYPWYVQPNGKA